MKTTAMITVGFAFALLSFTTSHKASRSLASASVSAPYAASIKWIRQEIGIGEVPQGTPVTFEFEFTNTGSEPVLITDVKASCGCTTPDYSKLPVKPGEKGTVKAVYNAAAAGAFRKTVTVTTSADATPIVLTLSGTVVAAKG